MPDIPRHAARSSCSSPDEEETFMMPTAPSFKISKSIPTQAFFIVGALASSGIMEYQLSFTVFTTTFRYGRKMTPSKSLSTSTGDDRKIASGSHSCFRSYAPGLFCAPSHEGVVISAMSASNRGHFMHELGR